MTTAAAPDGHLEPAWRPRPVRVPRGHPWRRSADAAQCAIRRPGWRSRRTARSRPGSAEAVPAPQRVRRRRCRRRGIQRQRWRLRRRGRLRRCRPERKPRWSRQRLRPSRRPRWRRLRRQRPCSSRRRIDARPRQQRRRPGHPVQRRADRPDGRQPDPRPPRGADPGIERQARPHGDRRRRQPVRPDPVRFAGAAADGARDRPPAAAGAARGAERLDLLLDAPPSGAPLHQPHRLARQRLRRLQRRPGRAVPVARAQARRRDHRGRLRPDRSLRLEGRGSSRPSSPGSRKASSRSRVRCRRSRPRSRSCACSSATCCSCRVRWRR